jgi:ABC-2 type transport system permease protein
MSTSTRSTSELSPPGTLSIGLSRIGIELKQLFRDREAFVFTLALPMILMLVFGSVFGSQ